MSKFTKPFKPDETKPASARLDEVFNHMREQLDFLCESAEFQNAILQELYDNSNNGSNQSKNTDN